MLSCTWNSMQMGCPPVTNGGSAGRRWQRHPPLANPCNNSLSLILKVHHRNTKYLAGRWLYHNTANTRTLGSKSLQIAATEAPPRCRPACWRRLPVPCPGPGTSKTQQRNRARVQRRPGSWDGGEGHPIYWPHGQLPANCVNRTLPDQYCHRNTEGPPPQHQDQI